MKINNIFAKIFPCVLAVGLLTACSGGHTHSAEGGWEVNAKDHWQTCECGETLNTAAHTLDDMGMCTVCGAEVWDYTDFVDVYTYSEYGDPMRMISYDADGSVTSDIRYEYEYDADGNKLFHQYYADNVLMEEAEYEAGTLVQCTSYYEDGTKTVSEYDEDGNIVRSVFYDADGSVSSTTESEYAYTADAESYEVKNTMTDFEGAKYIGEYNEFGDQTAWIVYDADGALLTEERYEYEYDADGDLMVRRNYTDGALTQELYYTIIIEADGWMRYPGTIIDYHADGSRIVTEYNEFDEIISETVYAADGTVIK